MDRSVRQSMDPVRRWSMDRGSVFLGHPNKLLVSKSRRTFFFLFEKKKLFLLQVSASKDRLFSNRSISRGH